MFDTFPKTKFVVLKPNGQSFEMKAIESRKGKGVMVEHSAIAPNVIETDDILEAHYSNGTQVKYIVIEPGFHEEWNVFAKHYQIKIRPYNEVKDVHHDLPFSIRNTNGSVIINTNSPHSQIDVQQNVSVFDKIENVIRDNSEFSNKTELVALVEQMKNSMHDKKTFAQSYGKFISAAANHMTILSPFLPALSAFLGS